jgi:hypothetical protein
MCSEPRPRLRIFLATKSIAIALLHNFTTMMKLLLASLVLSLCGAEEKYDPNDSCGLWLAPSTLPAAGLGLFAGRDYAKGERLDGGDGDIVIPLIDLPLHTQQRYDLGEFLWLEYTWECPSLTIHKEGTDERQECASTGFGAAANAFPALENVDMPLDVDYDFAGIHRNEPGAGAFSPYHNRKPQALRNIQAGKELFLSYGDFWMTPERKEEIGVTIPDAAEMNHATSLYRQYQWLKDQSSLPAQAIQDIWDIFVTHTPFSNARVLSAVNNSSPAELEALQKKSFSEIQQEQTTRSPSWLKENGACGDHIQSGRSTIKQAGRGAFATRLLPKGTLVSHLPLIHTERAALRMFNATHVLNNETGEMGLQIQGNLHDDRRQQLMLNYCFGHGNSDLLLCPYAPMAYV